MYRRNPFINFKRYNHKWVKPEGYNTGIKVYNCVTRSKEDLIVRNKHFVTWYTCGPTVYDSAHIGHASCFLKLDLIQRILREFFNLNIVTVMNITDVDDKIIARSKETKTPIKQLTQYYENEFWSDLDSLGITRPDCTVRVTENIEFIRKYIGQLLDNRKAYKAGDNSVYFDVGAYDYYGKLQNLSEEVLEEVEYKKSPMDFALWKTCKDGEISWDSPWGPGRPGWHIECSALATQAFGSNIDIHAGGRDLRFPHHENEEAQSCAFHNHSQWVNYWLHTGHLFLNSSEKMSKSLKNTVSINSMLQQTPAQVFRMACIMSHYRSSMEYTTEFMNTAKNLLKNYTNFLDNCKNYIEGYTNSVINDEIAMKLIIESGADIEKALTDDFNTPLLIKILNEIISKTNSMLHASPAADQNTKSPAIPAIANLVTRTLRMLGINIHEKVCEASDNSKFVEVMNILNEFRQEVRQVGISTKDGNVLKLCDSVRGNLREHGITLKDHGKVSTWSQ